MPSIVSGFEYDIFISYRQNDNRSDWVTEFDKALEEELAATIKDPVSVYFPACRFTCRQAWQAGTPTPTMASSKPTRLKK